MRFVGTCTIALATLASLVGVTLGQSPMPRGAHSSAAAPPRRAGNYQPTPAPSMATAWVSDTQPNAPVMQGGVPLQELPAPDQFSANPMPSQGYGGQVEGGQAYNGQVYGSQMYGGPSYGDPSSLGAMYGPGCEMGGPGYEMGGPCPDGGMPHGGPPGPHGHGHTDLWVDVHSHHRIWSRFQYLGLMTNVNKLPPLVTTSPAGTPQAEAGVLPPVVPGATTVIFGGNAIDTQMRQGGRLDVGYWLVDGEFFGVEGHYFAMEEASTEFNANSDQFPILARPFLNVNPNLAQPTPDADIVGFAGQTPAFDFNGELGELTGSIDIRTSSDLLSAGTLCRHLIWIDFTKSCRFDCIYGYRFLRYNDGVDINTQSTFIPNNPTLFNQIDFLINDSFFADNQFHGGEFGFVTQCYHGKFSLDLTTKVALGNNHQRVAINGSTIQITDGIPSPTTPGGLLSQPTNIGRYSRDTFAVLPELNATLRVDLTCHLRAIAGYSVIYLSNVQTSGNAIDPVVNTTQVQGGPVTAPFRPAFAFSDTDLFIHGVNAGLEYRW